MVWLLLLACFGTADKDPSDTIEESSTESTPSDTELGEETACGELVCATDELCYQVTGGVPDTAGEATISYSCEPLPEGCDGSCDCACDEVGGDCSAPEAGGRICDTAAP